ncbi:MAG TPA: hypothetical protein VD867_05875, partial [Burkholderiales bacterium]|nr:hypothetical protein [Burkholderiales bacterium]
SKQAIIDLTHKAASQLDMITAGKTRVTVQVLEWGKGGAKALRQVAQQAPVALTAATELLTAAGGLSSTDESK